jgi:hypothetical protein
LPDTLEARARGLDGRKRGLKIMAEKPLSGQAAAGRATFGLLPEAERSVGSFITSMAINGLMLAVFLYIGAAARKTIDQHRHEETLLILPTKPPPPPEKVKTPPPPPIKDPPKLLEVKFEAPKIKMPKPEPKPDLKPIQVEAKLAMPIIKEAKPAVILSPQPKSALAAAAMPAQDNHQKPSTAPVHFGQTFGVTPNPNATRPATVAAIGNPYGGMHGPASRAARSGGLDGFWQWNQVRIECGRGGKSGLGAGSGHHEYGPHGFYGQGSLGRYSDCDGRARSGRRQGGAGPARSRRFPSPSRRIPMRPAT